MALLDVSALTKKQDGALILNNINLSVPASQKTAIAGETGSGKSTLLRIMAGLIQPDSGEVLFEGRHVDGPLEKLVPGHPKIAYLSQQYELRNHYRVEELFEYANELAPGEAEKLIRLCHVEHLQKRWTNQLSGGERQRIALTRLLLGAPRVLLLDEPFSNLDPVHKNILKRVIRDLGEALSVTCVMVSHDPQDGLPWADELVVMKAGQVVQQGPPEIVYRQPVNAYAAALLGDYFLVVPDLLGDKTTPPPPPGKRLFLRPGDFSISRGDGAHMGTITGKNFMGHFYEYTVVTGDATFRIPSTSSALMPGERVSVEATAATPWYL